MAETDRLLPGQLYHNLNTLREVVAYHEFILLIGRESTLPVLNCNIVLQTDNIKKFCKYQATFPVSDIKATSFARFADG
jgi:hypothetical protein